MHLHQNFIHRIQCLVKTTLSMVGTFDENVPHEVCAPRPSQVNFFSSLWSRSGLLRIIDNTDTELLAVARKWCRYREHWLCKWDARLNKAHNGNHKTNHIESKIVLPGSDFSFKNSTFSVSVRLPNSGWASKTLRVFSRKILKSSFKNWRSSSKSEIDV